MLFIVLKHIYKYFLIYILIYEAKKLSPIAKLNDTLNYLYKETASAEQFSNKTVLLHFSNSEKVSINKEALYDLINDMDRNCETAGYLLGKYDPKSGKTLFSMYKPDRSIINRFKGSVNTNSEIQQDEISNYKQKGFNSIIFLHLHPNCYFNYSLEEKLNKTDKNTALNYHGIEAKKAGFEIVYEGILSKYSNTPKNLDVKEINKIFKLSLFDDLNTGKPESFCTVGNYNENKNHKLSQFLRKGPSRTIQKLKSELDELFMPMEARFGVEINKGLSNEDINKILVNVNENLDNTKLSFVHNRIHIYYESNEFEIKVDQPPKVIYSFFENQYNKIINDTINIIHEKSNQIK